jgi:hypothetical protein
MASINVNLLMRVTLLSCQEREAMRHVVVEEGWRG